MIGVFDSGFGGLTVMAEIVRRLPQYDYLYLGDRARGPYGALSPRVIEHYTRLAIEYLFRQGCPLVILACNTASAWALRSVQQQLLPARYPQHRVLGVVRPSVEALAGLEPGALPGVTAPGTASGVVAVLATEATVAANSYRIELARLAPRLQLIQRSCPLWVPLVEDGELMGPGTEYFLHKYLDPLFSPSAAWPDRILLGCTHYPLLLPGIRSIVPEPVEVLSQPELVAERLADWLRRHPEMESRLDKSGRERFLVTANAERFTALASVFMGRCVEVEEIQLADT